MAHGAGTLVQGCVTSWALAHHILIEFDSSSWTTRRGSWMIAGDLKTSKISLAISNTCAFHEKKLPDVICWCPNISDGYYGVLLHGCNLNFCLCRGTSPIQPGVVPLSAFIFCEFCSIMELPCLAFDEILCTKVFMVNVFCTRMLFILVP